MNHGDTEAPPTPTTLTPRNTPASPARVMHQGDLAPTHSRDLFNLTPTQLKALDLLLSDAGRSARPPADFTIVTVGPKELELPAEGRISCSPVPGLMVGLTLDSHACA